MKSLYKRLLLGIIYRGWPILSDKFRLKCYFRLKMGRRLDLLNPKTMNEKLQWLKLYNRRDIYCNLVDKIKVKDFVAGQVGQEYVVPLLGIWDRFDEIDFDSLPNQFVLKTSHGGGNSGVVIVPDKSKLNMAQAKKKLNSSLRTDIYRTFCEWPYKNVQKKIFAESYLSGILIDYKFYCFDGDVDCVLVCIDRQLGDTKYYFFDRNWRLCRCNKWGLSAPVDFSLPKPERLDEMFQLASKMSKGFPFVRLDYYEVNGKVYFGEYTFFPNSGFDCNRTEEAERYFGDKIRLPEVTLSSM